MPPDHYRTLGVPPDADVATLRRAYLQVMRNHHPDRRGGDPVSEQVARRANVAWHTLSDEARRAAYDRARAARSSSRARTGQRRVVAPPGAARPSSAYSAEGRRFRAAFHRACLRVAVVVLAVGTLLSLVAAA